MKAKLEKKKKRERDEKRCAQHVLGSQISQGAQVSRIKDVEKGRKNIHSVEAGATDTKSHRSMRADTHTSLSSLWTCRANPNPSLTITTESSEWTEVALADVMLAKTIPQIG